ncbi:MAG: response regulator [Pseudomonadota bacterium]
MEDDHAFATLLEADLLDRGHEVAIFGKASDALAFSDEHDIDLAISDIIVREEGMLSTDGGIKFISGLRQLQQKSVPIIAMSGSFGGKSGTNFATTAKTVGATAVLSKPFFPEELADLIEDLLERRG